MTQKSKKSKILSITVDILTIIGENLEKNFENERWRKMYEPFVSNWEVFCPEDLIPIFEFGAELQFGVESNTQNLLQKIKEFFMMPSN